MPRPSFEALEAHNEVPAIRPLKTPAPPTAPFLPPAPPPPHAGAMSSLYVPSILDAEHGPYARGVGGGMPRREGRRRRVFFSRKRSTKWGVAFFLTLGGGEDLGVGGGGRAAPKGLQSSRMFFGPFFINPPASSRDFFLLRKCAPHSRERGRSLPVSRPCLFQFSPSTLPVSTNQVPFLKYPVKGLPAILPTPLPQCPPPPDPPTP